jgi:DNA topoisomerase-1
MLNWLYDIRLSPPYEYDDTQGQGFPLKLEKTKGKKRWSSIVQRGPYFKEIMEPYVRLNASLSINGKIYNLEPEEEKVAGFYATRIRADAKDIAKTQYTKLEKFNQNFWKDFQKYLTPKAKSIFKSYNDFLQIDWSDLVEKLEQKTLAEKELAKTKQEKDRKKQKSAELKSEYGYAILDGKPLQKIGNYQVEISGIFIGKKGHPKLGRIKKQIMPEDVTINIGEKDPEPKAPLGHTWATVVNDYTSIWLASWKDEITKKIKYIRFSQEGIFKAQSDFNKYENARKLHFRIEKIRTDYMKLAESSNMVQKQIGTVLFLIDRFGIRIGNETESDKADPVVGATTLLVSNINVDKTNIVIFDFEGKDNVRFYKELKVPEIIYKNFKELKEGKKGHNQIFDRISSDNVNDYLKKIDPDFTAKVFRTRLGSEIMYKALQELPPIIPKSKKTHIRKEFNKANIKVAEVLNHVRTTGPTKSMETLKNALKEAEKEKNREKISKLTEQIKEKEALMSVAISTSLINYIDPRIVASWAKSQNVHINSVYNRTLEAKFKWAINLINSKDGEWSWEKSPLEEGEEQGEEEGEEQEEEEEEEEQPKKSRTRRSVIRERRPPKSETLESPSKTEKIRSRPKTQIPESSTHTETVHHRRYKKTTPRRKNKNYEEEQELKTAKVRSFKFNWQENIVESPEVLESYKLLLELCEKLKSGKINNYDLISKIDANVLKWVYPLSKEILRNIDNTSIYYKPNKYIIDYCDKKIFNSTPTPTFPKPPLPGPIFTPTPTPSPRPRTPLFTPTPSPTPQSEPLFTPTPSPTPSPEKAKAKAKPKQKIKHKKITEERFRYLNIYNQKDLREYCEYYNIECKGKNINEMQENVMKFFKFDPSPPFAIPRK